MLQTFSFCQGSAEQENSQLITGQPKKKAENENSLVKIEK